jgi:hypothetical protein
LAAAAQYRRAAHARKSMATLPASAAILSKIDDAPKFGAKD